MQGRLRRAPLTVRIDSRCATCARPITVAVDQDLRWRADPGPGPLVFEPSIDWARFRAPNIIDDY